MKNKAKIKYMDFRTFGGIYIGLAKTRKEFFKECKRLKILKEDLVADERQGRLWSFESKGKLTMILALNENLIPKVSKSSFIRGLHGLFVHEAVHAWQNVCEHIGENNAGSEMDAYHIQEIWHKFIEIYEGE